MKINFIDLHRQYKQNKTAIDAGIQEVIANTAFIMGPHVRQLENELAEYVGVGHAVGCASGTDALMLALMAYDIQPDDEIITSPFTFIATAEVIALLKARPVFVDIREDTFNIDPSKIEAAITEKTKGIIAVDIFGQCADYDEINSIAREHGLFVIEDAAQSFGAKYKNRQAGSLADIGCTSFFPAKPLGCFGDGGMVFSDDANVAAQIGSLRVHGQGADRYDNIRIGLNGRLDTLQAAILLAKFKIYPEEISQRQDAAAYYRQGLRGVIHQAIPDDCQSVYAQYSIRVPDRTALREHLKTKGIPTAIYYPRSLHQQKAFSGLGYKNGDFPIAEKICNDILAIPMHAYLTKDEQDFIIKHINTFYQKG